MDWQVRILYANGNQEVLRSFNQRETAIRCVDAIYAAWGYPMHLAYVVRPADPATVRVSA